MDVGVLKLSNKINNMQQLEEICSRPIFVADVDDIWNSVRASSCTPWTPDLQPATLLQFLAMTSSATGRLPSTFDSPHADGGNRSSCCRNGGPGGDHRTARFPSSEETPSLQRVEDDGLPQLATWRPARPGGRRHLAGVEHCSTASAKLRRSPASSTEPRA